MLKQCTQPHQGGMATKGILMAPITPLWFAQWWAIRCGSKSFSVRLITTTHLSSGKRAPCFNAMEVRCQNFPIDLLPVAAARLPHSPFSMPVMYLSLGAPIHGRMRGTGPEHMQDFDVHWTESYWGCHTWSSNWGYSPTDNAQNNRIWTALVVCFVVDMMLVKNLNMSFLLLEGGVSHTLYCTLVVIITLITWRVTRFTYSKKTGIAKSNKVQDHAVQFSP